MPAERVVVDAVLAPARLKWQGDQPTSLDFQDIYHSPQGIDEVHRVFIQPDHLPERIRANQATEFTVGELGFGTGLNFAVLADLFLRESNANTRLHFISFEKHPISFAEFAAMARRRSVDLPIYAELANIYPPLLSGWHKRYLANGRVVLSVYFGAAEEEIVRLVKSNSRLDVLHWFLDGFAPAANTDMWSGTLFNHLAGLSASGCTLASFTAVGQVRRDLQTAGFSMRKVSQQPHKRHSLAGVLNAQEPDDAHQISAIVVGSGIAGASIAARLAEQGVNVSLIDATIETQPRTNASQRTCRASAISPAILHARLLADDSITALMRSRSYLHASAFLSSNAAFNNAGALQTLGANTSEEKLQRLYHQYHQSGPWIQLLSAGAASERAGLKLKHPALYFPGSGMLDLDNLCVALRDHKNITHINAYVQNIEMGDLSGNSVWQVHSDTGTFTANNLILCPGDQALHFTQLDYLELVKVGGQLNGISNHFDLKLPIIGQGFICPNSDGKTSTIGATYEHRSWSSEEASEYNLSRFEHWWSELTDCDLQNPVQLRNSTKAMRCVSSDRVPVIGSLYNQSQLSLPGLHVSCAHGSSGLTSATMAAEIITAKICQSLPIFDPRIVDHCDSLRFRQRQARRGKKRGQYPFSE